MAATCEVVVTLEAEGPAVDRSVKRGHQRRHLTLFLTPHHHNRTWKLASVASSAGAHTRLDIQLADRRHYHTPLSSEFRILTSKSRDLNMLK
jgi:hypothetical protein